MTIQLSVTLLQPKINKLFRRYSLGRNTCTCGCKRTQNIANIIPCLVFFWLKSHNKLPVDVDDVEQQLLRHVSC